VQLSKNFTKEKVPLPRLFVKQHILVPPDLRPVMIANVVDDLGYRGGGVTAYNGPIAGENGDDVIIDCSTPTNQSARTCAELTSLETLFVNIQGLLNMAIERSRDREQQISYEKGITVRVYFEFAGLKSKSHACSNKFSCDIYLIISKPLISLENHLIN